MVQSWHSLKLETYILHKNWKELLHHTYISCTSVSWSLLQRDPYITRCHTALLSLPLLARFLARAGGEAQEVRNKGSSHAEGSEEPNQKGPQGAAHLLPPPQGQRLQCFWITEGLRTAHELQAWQSDPSSCCFLCSPAAAAEEGIVPPVQGVEQGKSCRASNQEQPCLGSTLRWSVCCSCLLSDFDCINKSTLWQGGRRHISATLCRAEKQHAWCKCLSYWCLSTVLREKEPVVPKMEKCFDLQAL